MNTALFLAVAHGQMQMLDHLTNKYNTGQASLTFAIGQGQIALFDYLLKHHPQKVSLAEKCCEKPPVLIAALAGQIKMLKHLLEIHLQQASLMEKDYWGYTPLLLAVKDGHFQMVDYLLEYYPQQVSLAEKDNNGNTALLLAAAEGRLDMFAHLLERYPQQVSLTGKNYKGQNALMLATENGKKEMQIYILTNYPEQFSVPEELKCSEDMPASSLPDSSTNPEIVPSSRSTTPVSLFFQPVTAQENCSFSETTVDSHELEAVHPSIPLAFLPSPSSPKMETIDSGTSPRKKLG
jgi:hypothetical protein